VQTHKFISDRVREMSADGQPGTIEIGPVEPREGNAPGSHNGIACENSGSIREGSSQALKSGVELAPNSVQRQGVFLSKERTIVDSWNSSIFGRPAFSVDQRLMLSQTKGNAKAKKWRDDWTFAGV
jgi:hypothetical protein